MELGSVVEVPSYFLCPISLQIMRDPVTLSTGITYDRDSIEHWLFSGKRTTCPLTNQPLLDTSDDLIPNHTLRRLIQAWCVANASERYPTPRPPVDRAQILALLDDAKLPSSRISSIRKLRTIVSESDRNKRCVEAAGAADTLTSIIKSSSSISAAEERDEALALLYYLNISDQALVLLVERNEHLVETLTTILHRSSNYESRAYAMLLLESILAVTNPARLMISIREEFFQETVRVLRDRISYQANRAALRALHSVCPWGNNRSKAVGAGAVSVLIELLMEETERRPCEMMLVVLDQLCGCAEGRAELVGHAAGMAVVSKKMFRVAPVATRAAVRVVYSVATLSATPAVLQEMLEVGVVSKLCMLLQVDCGESTREKVKEMLRMHSRVWRNSPCVSPKLSSNLFR